MEKNTPMTLLEKILTWSKEIPPWQSDILRRLLQKRELDDSDYADLVVLAKAHSGVADKDGRAAEPLGKEHIPVTGAQTGPLFLLSVGDLKNVNAIVNGETLRFAERGVTIIYGDNGSGKSGYARVLKRACRARDEESVLPNAALPKEKQGKPEAVLTVSVGGKEQPERWKDGKPGPESLSALSVFDGHCARVYLDEESDIAFKPYGLDLVEDLGKACVKVREKIQAENQSIRVDLSVFDDLKGSTKVGDLVSALSEKTDPKQITALAAFSPEERKRIEELDAILKEGSPVEKAKTLRNTASRINRLADACESCAKNLADTEVARFRCADEAVQAAQKASDLVLKGLQEDPGLLPGTGGATWKALLLAAEKYSAEAYPGHSFPHIAEDAKCVLCQQELAEGKDRYKKFGEFLASVAEEELRKASKALKAAEEEISRIDVALPMDQELLGDIRALEASLATTCEGFASSISRRRQFILKAVREHTWDAVEPLLENAALSLHHKAAGLVKSAEALEASADKEVAERLRKERLEFVAREKLAPRKDSLIQASDQLRYKTSLSECASAIDTAAISRKSKALTQEAVSAALAGALNREFASLGIDHLKVTFATRVEYGKTLQKLRLELPSAADIANILSEGEQRALAIASFLAEISLAPGSSGLIFDDPVSSLDHVRREKVAARLVSEGGRRQIIIFTHDLFFLSLLMGEAGRQQVQILCQSVLKQGQRVGVLSPDLPFAGQSTSQRIGALKQLAQRASAAARAGNAVESDSLVKSGYDLLRQAWERAVEETLLQGVVERFERGVHTLKLAGVSVEEDDFVEVTNAMTRCSVFTGHDSARAAGPVLLEPAAFEKDVLELEAFHTRIARRADVTKKARKVKVTAPKPAAAAVSQDKSR